MTMNIQLDESNMKMFYSRHELATVLGISGRTIARLSYCEKSSQSSSRIFKALKISRRVVYYLPQVLQALGIDTPTRKEEQDAVENFDHKDVLRKPNVSNQYSLPFKEDVL